MHGLGNQISYPAIADIASPGTIRQRIKVDTAINAGGDTQQEIVIDVGTPANSTLYAIAVNGSQSVNFTSDANATALEIRDGLIARFKSHSVIGSRFAVAPASATSLKLTHRFWGVNEQVTVSGGGTGYVATATPATVGSFVPYGRVAARKPNTELIDGLPLAGLASGASDGILGIFAKTMAVPLMAGQVEAQYRRGDRMNVLSQGVIWAVAETAIALGDSLFYRHTAAGNFTALSVLSNASGAGKAAIARFRPESDSTTLSDGTILVPVAVNMP